MRIDTRFRACLQPRGEAFALFLSAAVRPAACGKFRAVPFRAAALNSGRGSGRATSRDLRLGSPKRGKRRTLPRGAAGEPGRRGRPLPPPRPAVRFGARGKSRAGRACPRRAARVRSTAARPCERQGRRVDGPAKEPTLQNQEWFGREPFHEFGSGERRRGAPFSPAVAAPRGRPQAESREKAGSAVRAPPLPELRWPSWPPPFRCRLRRANRRPACRRSSSPRSCLPRRPVRRPRSRRRAPSAGPAARTPRR